ncbi:MAG: glycosyltransferase family 25 protein, partial [Rhodobacteraceae bacterium]|nr:glycosyltransferase family 25 protein [Paracoccaceae bacterium]
MDPETLTCLVINLDNRVERMEFMSKQLESLGLDYTRIEAIKPAQAMKAKSPSYWDSWERPLRGSECACLMSHQIAWNIIVKSETPMLVLEDDVLLSQHLPEVLANLKSLNGINYLCVEAKPQLKYVCLKQPPLHITDHKLIKLILDQRCAGAYVLWPSGAELLLQQTTNAAAPADKVLGICFELQSYQLEPAGAVQLCFAPEFGISAPFQYQSDVFVSMMSKSYRLKPKYMMRRLKSGIRK